MQKDKYKTSPKKKSKKGFDIASLFFSFLAIALIAIGIYLNYRHRDAVGVSQPGRYGQGGGKILSVPGLFVIVIGLFFASFPTIDLIRYIRNKL